MDSQSRDDLRRLVRERPGVAGLTGAPRPAPVLSTAALGKADQGAGIASPLTEPDAAARTYHDSHYVYSSDGFFALNVAPLNTIDMLDANGAAVQMVFDDPYA